MPRPRKKASRIAALQTDAQVLDLIHPLGWEYAEATLGDSAAAAYKPYRFTRFAVRSGQTWFKADFDQNGLPDLLVLAQRKNTSLVFCVLDMGSKLLVVRNFYNVLNRRYPVARVVVEQGQHLLEYADYARSHGPRRQLQNRRTQLLSYVGGGFVEYNAHPTQHRIQRVEYEGYSVYHQAIRTRITVTEESVHLWRRRAEALDTTKVTMQQRASRLLPAQKIQLAELLNYIKFAGLPASFALSPQNHRTHVKLVIEYNDGQRKVVEDLNGTGTAGLRQLYRLLNGLVSSP
ncbi:hypothetical protein LRS06_16315 [Hymenobacter sp. J193]|uniref:hypothetical protein n=1 Tax=Hymenobacter sp. J193 TaxID=2898429 RepID=UPI0021511042|nr:hypothetical protein [Hymenobacter sp. J193]MCR5889301.1 hypothetical protein [Hymenobacter sp. J193]